ncbi:hypothetical protein ACFLZT_07585 [Thermodesulfobacteriota bacterium]
MKIAVCFYGLVGSKSHKDGKGTPLPPELAHAYYQDNIFAHQSCDIFIHSWSIEHKQNIIELYKPKSFLIEPQKYFTIAPKLCPKLSWKDRLFSLVNKNIRVNSLAKYNSIHRAYSRWYSNKQTLKLMENYEDQTGIKYDCVMVTRLDIAFFNKIIFSDYNLDIFWASHWNDPPLPDNNFQYNYENHYQGTGFLDFWFFSNSNNMKQFGMLFDKIEDYHPSPHRASYEHVTTFTDRIGYTFFRWIDHEMIRRKFFSSQE